MALASGTKTPAENCVRLTTSKKMIDDLNRELRNALGCFATGITVITALDKDQQPMGMTVNSFASVSLEPPLISWCLAKNCHFYDAFMAAEHFAVNILSDQQENLSQLFASPIEDKFAQADWQPGIEGLPLLAGCIAHLECQREQDYPGGDHSILIGRVLNFDYNSQSPLIFSQCQYSRIE